MSNLDRWIISNKLSLNLSKTKYIIFSHNAVPQNLDIFIRNEKLSRVSNTNFLGIHIDEKLTFKHHVNFLSNKISRSIGILYRIKSFLPSSVLISLYYAFVQSHLSYGIFVHGENLLKLTLIDFHLFKIDVSPCFPHIIAYLIM